MARLPEIMTSCCGGRLRSSFKARLFAGISAIILLVSTVFAAILFYQQYRSQKESSDNQGKLMARLLARDVRLAVFAGNRHQILLAAQGVMSFPDVQTIEVLDRAGEVLARLSRPQGEQVRQAEFRADIPGLLNKEMEQQMLVGRDWDSTSESAIGTVRIVIDRGEIDRQLFNLMLMALLATAGCLTLGILAAYLLAEGMTRPLSQLSAAADALQGGDDRVRVPVDTADEVGRLAASFNGMVDAIRERKLELEQALGELYDLNVRLEEKVAERTAQLENANRELESFNYSASHDLRAPLNRLSGYCDALREEYADRLDEQGKHYLQRIAAVGEQMHRVLSAMLTLYQVQQREMTSRPLNLSELVQAVIASLREADRSRNVTVSIQEDVTAFGDMKLIWLALENLLGNAWKFTRLEADARIDFGRMDREGEKVCFIRDNGTGFDMQYADKLFAPFQRLHNQDEFPGTGVGLAIVQRIIHRHGGRIWLESSEGAGTTCYFTLPDPPPPRDEAKGNEPCTT
jgi:signal transduction histidine kinase